MSYFNKSPIKIPLIRSTIFGRGQPRTGAHLRGREVVEHDPLELAAICGALTDLYPIGEDALILSSIRRYMRLYYTLIHSGTQKNYWFVFPSLVRIRHGGAKCA